MMDEPEQEFKPWQSWADVPEDVKAQLLSIPRQDGLKIASSDSFADVIRKIAALLK